MTTIYRDTLFHQLGYRIGQCIVQSSIAIALYIADQHLWPTFKRFLVTSVYIAPTCLVPLIANTQARLRLSIASGFVVLFVHFPANLSATHVASMVWNLIAPPLVQRSKLASPDNVIEELLNTGLTKTLSFVGTALFLRYWRSLCGLLIWFFVRTLSLYTLVAICALWYLWKKFQGEEVENNAITYCQKGLEDGLRYLLKVTVASGEGLCNFVDISTNILTRLEVYGTENIANLDASAEPISFCYSPLNPRHIRLLRVQRRRPLARLRCDIVTVLLDDDPSFEALSYTWRGETPTAKVLVSGGSFLMVTPAIHEFLHYQQTYFESKTFWIDAVCINQSGNEERNHQVRLMREIYKQASRVIVWLGPRIDATDAYLARERLHYLVGLQRILGLESEAFHEQLTFPKNTGWEALSTLLQHPWFNRVWVVQEVALAKRVDVMYGNVIISWEDLASCVEIYVHPRICGLANLGNDRDAIKPFDALQKKVMTLTNAGMIARLRKTLLSKESEKLLYVLVFCSNFRSTDPRDKVYGLLGLVSGVESQSLNINYDASVTDVYVQATRCLLEQEYSAELPYILQFAGVGLERSVDLQELPSWVPDWKVGLPTHAWAFIVPNTYNTSVNGLDLRPEVMFTEGPNEIKIRGTLLDTITQIAESIKIDTFEEGLSVIANLYSAVESLVEFGNHTHYVDQDSVDVAFYNLILGTDATDTDFISDCDTKTLLDALNTYKAVAEQCSISATAKEREVLDEMLRQIAAELAPYNTRFGECCLGRRMMSTKDGRLGLVPIGTRVGDLIVNFRGVWRPFVLRRQETSIGEEETRFQLVGTCYVDGLQGVAMDSEADTCFTLI